MPKARQAIIEGVGRIGWRTCDLAVEPARGFVRVRTLLSLISPGTELRLYLGEPMYPGIWSGFALDLPVMRHSTQHPYSVGAPPKLEGPTYPVGFGYNNVGEVIAVGEGVSAISIGDRVFTIAGHRDVFDVQEWEATIIPMDVGNQCAVFAYIASLGISALRSAAYLLGENVAVIGLGLVGLTGGLVARACGARGIWFEIDETRRRFASKIVPEALVLDPSDDAFALRLERELAPFGVDLVLEAGAGAASLGLALRIADRGGRVAIVSLHTEDVGAFLAHEFHMKKISLVPTGNDPYEDPTLAGNRFTTGRNLHYILDLMRRQSLELDQLVTHVISPQHIDDVFSQLTSGDRSMIGVLIDWG